MLKQSSPRHTLNARTQSSTVLAPVRVLKVTCELAVPQDLCVPERLESLRHKLQGMMARYHSV